MAAILPPPCTFTHQHVATLSTLLLQSNPTQQITPHMTDKPRHKLTQLHQIPHSFTVPSSQGRLSLFAAVSSPTLPCGFPLASLWLLSQLLSFLLLHVRFILEDPLEERPGQRDTPSTSVSASAAPATVSRLSVVKPARDSTSILPSTSPPPATSLRDWPCFMWATHNSWPRHES